MGLCRTFGGLPFEEGDVLAVDLLGAPSVVNSDGTVEDVVILECSEESCVSWAAEETIKFTSRIGRFDLTSRKFGFVVRYSLKV